MDWERFWAWRCNQNWARVGFDYPRTVSPPVKRKTWLLLKHGSPPFLLSSLIQQGGWKLQVTWRGVVEEVTLLLVLRPPRPLSSLAALPSQLSIRWLKWSRPCFNITPPLPSQLLNKTSKIPPPNITDLITMYVLKSTPTLLLSRSCFHQAVFRRACTHPPFQRVVVVGATTRPTPPPTRTALTTSSVDPPNRRWAPPWLPRPRWSTPVQLLPGVWGDCPLGWECPWVTWPELRGWVRSGNSSSSRDLPFTGRDSKVSSPTPTCGGIVATIIPVRASLLISSSVLIPFYNTRRQCKQSQRAGISERR